MRAILLLALGLCANTAWADYRMVTLQVRDKDGRVRSTEIAFITEALHGHSVSYFVRSRAKTDCERIKAGACKLREIYRKDFADGTVRSILQCDRCDPLVDTLKTGDILVFYQGGYCCGY